MAAAVSPGLRVDIHRSFGLNAIGSHDTVQPHASTSTTPSAFTHRSSASASSAAPPTKSFKRSFRSSLQETFRHVSAAGGRKGKDREKAHGDAATPAAVHPPPSFYNKYPRPSGIRGSLDSHNDRPNGIAPSKLKDKPTKDPARHSFDALTQKSTSTSIVSYSGSDRDKDKERPRVLRKRDSRSAVQRRAETPDTSAAANKPLLSPIPPASASPSPLPPAESKQSAAVGPGPGWASYVAPSLSKGSMSSPTLLLAYNDHVADQDRELKPARRQRSALTSIGAFLSPPRGRKLSGSIAPPPSASAASRATASPPSRAVTSASPSPRSPQHSLDLSPNIKPISKPSKIKPAKPVPAPLTISRPKAMLSSPSPSPALLPPLSGPGTTHINGNGNGNGRSSPSTPVPKSSRIIGMGHPSTSTRRVAASTPHLPLPTPSTPPAVVPVAPRVASPHSPTPSAPATPSRRARSPTASTSASRARSTSVTATRTSSPLTPHGVSPVTPRATSPATRRPPPLLGTGVGSASTSHLPLSSPGGSGLPPASPRLVPRRSSHGHSSSVPIVLRTKSPSPSPDASRTPSHPLGHRVHSSSTSSLPGPSPSAPQRELIRSAASVLVKEMVNRRSSFSGPSPTSPVSGKGGHPGLSAEALDEVESRMRVLARMERIWGRSGVGASSVGGGLGGSEDREKNAFVDALQDGYVLCQFLNKLRPGSIPRVDPSSGKGACDANISKFLVAATSYGVLSDELFDPSDFALASSQSIGRVAQTIIAIARIADSPPPRKFVSKSPSSIAVTSSVYTGPTVSSASTPNLLVARSTSPSSPKQKRWSPPAPGLPTVRSASPSESEKLRERERKSQEEEEGDVFGPMEGVTSQQRVGARASTTSRTSVASSSQTSDTTNAYSSLLDYRLSTRYGTIRTMTTEATSLGTDAPSLTRTEASSAAASVAAAAAAGDKDLPMRTRSKRSSLPGTPAPSNTLDESPRRRDRKVSDGLGVVDLSRVAEETDEGSVARRLPPNSPSSNKPPPIRLGKGKWPDDFMNAFESARPNPAEVLEGNGGGRRSLDSPTSPSKHRMARTSNSVDLSLSLETIEPISPLALPRRRSSRNNTDALLPREVSPSPSRDSLTPSPVSGGVRQPVLRRSTTRAYVPRATCEERSAPDASVPFPKAEGSTLAALPSSSETLHGESYTESPADSTKPLYQRTRHRSEMDKERRSSFGDQTGQKPTGRSRYESMVNLGGNNDFPKGETSLIGGMDGSAVRKPLVVKEEGKAPTHYQLGNCIGRGQFGSVYRALNLNTGQMVAVKRIRLEGLSESEVAQLMHEVELVKRLSHPSIVKYEGMARDSDTLNIVLEYAENGSLAQTLKAFGKLNEALVATYVTKVLEGLHYLHTSQVVHCDLKAANILTTKTGNVKLSDFGVSLNLRAMEQIKNDVAGTPNWMAPEVIELKGASPASDIWSLACTIIELLTGRPPYADVQNGMSVMFRIVEDPMPPIPEGLSGPLQDFLKLCFNKDPVQRPNAEVLFEHPWLKKEWGIYKELRPQDSIPFLRRVSADLQRPGIRRFSFLEEDVISPRASNGSTQPEFTPHPHTFVKSTFSQPVTCRVCNHPIKKNAVFCTECSLIAHSKCATEAPQTCDLRAQVIRLSLDLQREAVRQQSPSPHPASPISVFSNSPPKLSDSPLSSSPDRFKMFVRKKSKASGVGSDPADPPKATTPPVAFKYDDTNPTKRMLLPRLRNNEDNSHSRASIASSHQSSSMRSAVTATGSLSSGGVAEAGERVRPTSDLRHRTSRLTASSLVGEMMMSAEAGEEAYLKRKGTRRGKRDSDTSKNGCVVQ